MILVLILITSSTAIGLKFLNILHVDTDNDAELISFSMAIGIGLISYLVFAVGMAGRLYAWVVILLFGLLAILCLRELRFIFLLMLKKCSQFKLPRFSLFSWILLAILLIHIIFNFFTSLAPPTHGDALRYHLKLPSIYVSNHEIIPVFWNQYSAFPSISGMIFTVGAVFENLIFPGVFVFCLSIMILVTLYSFVIRYLGDKYLLPVITACYCFPMMTALSSPPLDYLFLTLFSLLSVYALMNWYRTDSVKWLIISGLMAGFAMASKHFGGLAFVALSVLIITRACIERHSFRKTIRNILLFGFLAGLVVSPWYLRAYAQYNNPVWPIANGIFNGKYWSQEYTEMAKTNLTNAKAKKDIHLPEDLLLGPWNLTMNGDKFGKARGGITYIFLCFISLLVVIIEKDKLPLLASIALFTIIYYIFWALTWVHNSEKLFLIYPLLSILAGYTFVRLVELGDTIIPFVCETSFLIALLFSLAVNLAYNAQFVPVVLGSETKNEFLSKYSFFYDEFQYINENLPDDAKILLYELDNTLYLKKPSICGMPGWSTGYLDYGKFNNSKDLLLWLKSKKVTHVLMSDRTYSKYNANTYFSGFFKKVNDLSFFVQYFKIMPVFVDKYLNLIHHKKYKFYESKTLKVIRDADAYLFEIKPEALIAAK